MNSNAPPVAPKRILCIDGGGVRGLFSLEILDRIESLLRQHCGKADLVLADHFDLIAGTSVGGILGAFLSWGSSVAEIRTLFTKELANMFTPTRWWKMLTSSYRREPLSDFLVDFFSEDDGSPALLGTARLRTHLLIVVRNLTTGGAWPLTNHPEAAFNRDVLPDGTPNPRPNLNIPLWQLIRGSTAAPWYFPSERVEMSNGNAMEFVDGGTTAYNNPAFIAYGMATLPGYPFHWPVGVDRLRVVSVGSGRIRPAAVQDRLPGRLEALRFLPNALIDAATHEQDFVMRCLGECVHGEPLDGEVGAMLHVTQENANFRYARYNRTFSAVEIAAAEEECGTRFTLSAVALAPWLVRTGREYAENSVRLEHLM